jgi:hypothetical protein
LYANKKLTSLARSFLDGFSTNDTASDERKP